jgi:hypothetical protein
MPEQAERQIHSELRVTHSPEREHYLLSDELDDLLMTIVAMNLEDLVDAMPDITLSGLERLVRWIQ